MMTPRFAASLLTALCIGMILLLAGQWIDKARDAMAQNQLRGEVAQATQGNLATAAEADADAELVTNTTEKAADAYHQSKSEEESREPTARSRNARPVPDSVRERARARRVARERSTGDG